MCVNSFCSCIPSTVWPLVSNWQGKFMLTSREVGLLDKTWWGQILRCLPLNLLRLSGNPIINSTSHYRKKTVATMPTVCSLFLMIFECCITSETSGNIYHFELWSRKNGDQQSGSTCHARAVHESCMDLRWTQIQICSLKTVALVTDKIFWDISSCITWMRVLCLWKRNAWLLLGLLVVMRWESYELELPMLWLCLTACVLLNALHNEIEIHYVSLA
jgi:hypothetical protein